MSKRITMTLVSLCMALSANLIMSSDALAHHGWGGYDANKTLTLTGAVTESSYTNPHGVVRAPGRRR